MPESPGTDGQPAEPQEVAERKRIAREEWARGMYGELKARFEPGAAQTDQPSLVNLLSRHRTGATAGREPWEGDGPCQDCGDRNIYWCTPNVIWNAVMGSTAGVLCPTCFVIRAYAAGRNPVWRLLPALAVSDQDYWLARADEREILRRNGNLIGTPDPLPLDYERSNLVRRTGVQPDWCRNLSLQQQSTLLAAIRGPDGVVKDHPCKEVVRAYRGSVLVAGRIGRLLEWGEHSDTFMSLRAFGDLESWTQAVLAYLGAVDVLPHHYHLHLMHGAEILGYKHPDERFRSRWGSFYRKMCEDLHLRPETERVMDERLNDWGGASWGK